MIKKLAVAMAAAGALMVAATPAHAAHVSLSLGLGLPLPGVYAAALRRPPIMARRPSPTRRRRRWSTRRRTRAYRPTTVPDGYYGPHVVLRAGPYWHGGYYHHGWRR